jgi:hypothetical protein
MFRLYYWYRGSEVNRTGGPWWVETFPTQVARARFQSLLTPQLHAYAHTDGGEVVDATTPAPPRAAKIVYLHGQPYYPATRRP